MENVPLFAGYHVLLEKPMEVTEADCEAILAAQKKSGAKLMIAYRLHHEPGTLDVIDRVRKGDFGDPRIFSSVFTQNLKPENHRAKQGNRLEQMRRTSIFNDLIHIQVSMLVQFQTWVRIQSMPVEIYLVWNPQK